MSDGLKVFLGAMVGGPLLGGAVVVGAARLLTPREVVADVATVEALPAASVCAGRHFAKAHPKARGVAALCTTDLDCACHEARGTLVRR